MSRRKVSVRGNLVRDMMQNVMETSLKQPIRTGELRKNPVEPAWVRPAGYEYEIIELEHLKMEYLRPVGVVTDRVILQLHGGGYIGPMKNIYRRFAVRYSKLSYGGDVLTLDYRVAPEHPYPAALEDAVAAYQWLIEEKGYRPEHIAVAGDSAGGGLSLALGLYLKDHGIALPGGFITMSAWTDLTNSGESRLSNYEIDRCLEILRIICFTIRNISAERTLAFLIFLRYLGNMKAFLLFSCRWEAMRCF